MEKKKEDTKMTDADVITPDSFRFFRTFYEASKMIGDDKSRLKFYDAISEYVFINKLPPFLEDESGDGRLLNMAWLLVKPVVDKSIGNSNGGRNSGGDRPSMRGNQNAQKQHDCNSQSSVGQQSINRDKERDKGIGMDKDKGIGMDVGVGETRNLTPSEVFDYLASEHFELDSTQLAKCYAYVTKRPLDNWQGSAIEWYAKSGSKKIRKGDKWQYYNSKYKLTTRR